MIARAPQEAQTVPHGDSITTMASAPHSTVNPAYKRIDYPLRGPLIERFEEIRSELSKGVKKPFDKVIVHYGDPQGLGGQKPITFVRQVFSLLMYPELLMDDPRFPQDVKERVKEILSHKAGCSMSSYTASQGLYIVRQHVADFISERDGYPCHPSDIFLANGGSVAIQVIFKGMQTGGVGNEREGFFLALPQYSLYKAKILELDSYMIPYYLDEDNDWQINIQELEEALQQAKPHCVPKVFILTNPGNPTGHVLPRNNIEDVIKFCHRNQLVLFADEVYQENIYTEELPFYSCRQVLLDMGPEYKDAKLISLHCTSKGFFGEPSVRGAYFEMHGFDNEVKHCFERKLTLSACPNIVGQVAISLMCKPPKPGDESYDLFIKEKTAILESFREKAIMTAEILNQLPGVTCSKVTGAMYAFPKLTLPSKAIEEAKRCGVEPDYLYASGLLEETGILAFYGSVFGQRPGTSHFRITILPPIEDTKLMFKRIKKYHEEFMKKYS